GFGRFYFLQTSRCHLAFLDEPSDMPDIYPGPTAFRPARGKFLHPGVSVKRQLFPIDPAETQRLVERLGIRDRWNTRIFLVNPQKQLRSSGVLLRQPRAQL